MATTELPPVGEEIDWDTETAKDREAEALIEEKLIDLEVPDESIRSVLSDLQTDSNRVIRVPGTEYRVARGVGHQLIILEFSGGQNVTIFTAGETGFEKTDEKAPGDISQAA